jgi:hypothetical protein
MNIMRNIFMYKYNTGTILSVQVWVTVTYTLYA